MGKLTHLSMVQDILNDMDSDEVNSVSDTVESQQVGQVIETTFFELMANKIWPHLRSLFRLDGLGNIAQPTHMKLPENVRNLDNIVSIKYNQRRLTDTKDKILPVHFRSMEAFLTLTNGYDSSEATVQTVIDTGGATIYIKNDRPPEFWTSFDDEHIIFNSFDSEVDTTLQSSKSQLVGYREVTFSQNDEFIADLPSKYFPMFLAEAKSVCFNALKQLVNEKAEQQTTRQKRYLSQQGWKANAQNRYPNYGRQPVGGRAAITHTNPLFDKG